MTTTRMLLTAAAAFALLVALATGGSDFNPDHALTRDGGVGGGAGAGAAEAGVGAVMSGSQGDGGSDKERSLAAFVASPVYGGIAPKEPPTEEAGPVVSRGGVPCLTLTQTIDIGGQTVPASAVICRQSNGTWQLDPPQITQLVPTSAGNEPSALTERAASRGRHCVRGGPVPCAASGVPSRNRAIAVLPGRHAEGAKDRPNR
ncbi:MAG TPA: hypothetical protein VHT04_01280 [Stellaceae bacterium]|nr:hypothetical protein [Stellaceae bacterium]